MDSNTSKSKKITVAQIAQAAGVSPATVSRVVNQKKIVKGDTYDHVIQTMKNLGYTFKNTNAINSSSSGVILCNIPSLENPFYGNIIKAARTSALRHDYTLFINEGHINTSTLNDLISIIKENHISGLITMNHISTPVLKKLSETTCVVQCAEYNEEFDLPYISIDDVSAAKNAVDHILAQGRTRIALINGPIRYKYARHRMEGYKMALEEAGIPLTPEYIIQLPEIDADLAISAAMQLLSLKNPPDAFFVVSDIYAAAVLRACHLSGKKVPEQVSVVGFDNLSISKSLIPSLSTVNQPSSQMGFMAMEILIEKLANPSVPNKKILLETELIIRESSSL